MVIDGMAVATQLLTIGSIKVEKPYTFKRERHAPRRR